MPMPRQSLLLLLFLALFSSSAINSVTSTNNEAIALHSWLQTSPSFSSHYFSNWNLQDPNPCRWTYITCSSESFVTEINIEYVKLAVPFPSNLSSLPHLEKLVISGVNLTGTISPDVKYCTGLTVLDLSSNSLAGDIPASIGELRSLRDLVLNSNQLTGEIPRELGGCAELRNLLIFDNYLSGNVPAELGKLSKLEAIRAGGNKDVEGTIPDELGNCESLMVLGLADTKISGSIPASLGRLRTLRVLSVYTTMLSGEIPPELGNCSELVDLFLYQNELSGSIPSELGRLGKLEKLLLWENNLVGKIPEEIGNCESLKVVDLSLNSLSGNIPKSFGNLSGLEELLLSNNNISGSIPSVLFNAANLVQLQLDTNQIAGTIPAEIGRLARLEVFLAWQNRLEGSVPSALAGCESLQALDLSHNELTGTLPPGLFQIRNLTKLLLISNHISGSIPPEIGDCVSLVRVRLLDNRISGEIPKEIGFLKSLSFLDLSKNRLSGSVPREIGNCTELQLLNLSNNTLGGNLPSSLSSLTKLQVLDVSVNKFEGQIPESFGKLASINRLVLGRNSLSGPIPSSLGRCSSLQLLDLGSNGLSGTIPVEIFAIESLEIALNLSFNHLSGAIPPQISGLSKLSVLDLSHNELGGELLALAGLVNLVSLNVSHNNFTGYLPDSKLFRQLSATDIEGNRGLCSTLRDSCFLAVNASTGKERNRSEKRFKFAMATLITLTLALSALGALAILRSRKPLTRSDDTDIESELGATADPRRPWQFTPFQKLSFTVEQVLKCLVEPNVIGKGCSGVVYRAELGSGEVIAVKKLWPAVPSAGKGDDHRRRDSFSAEVKTLGSIRHKNIVRFLGCCWNRRTRLLMYDYMANGSLGGLLHGNGNSGGVDGRCLEWEIRYRIVLGSAQGLAYLHHDCVPPIVHRDIKANNILIGDDFEAYIADFGLAKLVGADDDGGFARSSSTVAGSFGYIAPEYGYMMKITEKSDVYSFGIVMLEVLTGKQPIDPTIPEGLHIVDWVRQRRAFGAEQVLDRTLRARPDQEIDEMLQTLGVALLCVNPSPDDRPTMKDVAAMLNEIRQFDQRDQDGQYCMKVDVNVNLENVVATGNLNVGDHQQERTTSANDSGSSSRLGRRLRSINASFSASSLFYSSSSSSTTNK